MTTLIYGGSEGTEDVPKWAFSLVTLILTAIFTVSLQMGLNAQANDSKGQEK
jgi:hypothetical protein